LRTETVRTEEYHRGGTFSTVCYGECRNSTDTSGTDKLFTGQRLDTTGLYYYNARYYDPTIGRFISADIYVQDYTNPQTLNRYAYCQNNPLKYTDPSGWWTFGISINIMCGFGAGVNLSIGLFFDGKGDVGSVMTIGGGGEGGAVLSGGVQFQYTGADTLNKLQGTSNQSGFSINPDVVPLNIGLENVLGLDKENKQVYEGVNINIGIGVGTPFEMHSTMDQSEVNIFNSGETITNYYDTAGSDYMYELMQMGWCPP